MTNRDHPESIRRWQTAREQGSSCDAGYSRREYALTLHTRRGIVTLAACRFSDPTTTLRRALKVYAR